MPNAFTLPTIKYVNAIPETTRGGGNKGGDTSPYVKLMKTMNVPFNEKTGKGKEAKEERRVASFFVASEVPANITDATEREKAGKDFAKKKLTNRFSSVARRIRKTDPNMNFAFRTGQEDGAWGLFVYRNEDTVPGEPAAPPAG